MCANVSLRIWIGLMLLISILKWISYTVYVTLRYDVVSWKAMDMEPFLWAAELILSISANCIFLLPASLISLTLFFPPSLLCMYHIYKNIAFDNRPEKNCLFNISEMRNDSLYVCLHFKQNALSERSRCIAPPIVSVRKICVLCSFCSSIDRFYRQWIFFIAYIIWTDVLDFFHFSHRYFVVVIVVKY